MSTETASWLPDGLPNREGLVEGLDERVYHADATTLSQSGAKTILRSPAQFRYELEHPAEPSAAMIQGSLTHALVLEQPHRFAVNEYSYQKERKAWTERADEIKAAGLTTVSADMWRDAQGMADAVLTHPVASRLLTGGQAEVSAYAIDPVTGVQMRGRFDYLRSDMIVDLKTSSDANPSAFARSAANFKYHIQDRWYRELYRAITGEWLPFVFIVVESSAPYLVSVVQLDAAAEEAGSLLGNRAREIFRDCTESDLWPDWPTEQADIINISLPRWAVDVAWEIAA